MTPDNYRKISNEDNKIGSSTQTMSGVSSEASGLTQISCQEQTRSPLPIQYNAYSNELSAIAKQINGEDITHPILFSNIGLEYFILEDNMEAIKHIIEQSLNKQDSHLNKLISDADLLNNLIIGCLSHQDKRIDYRPAYTIINIFKLLADLGNSDAILKLFEKNMTTSLKTASHYLYRIYILGNCALIEKFFNLIEHIRAIKIPEKGNSSTPYAASSKNSYGLQKKGF